MMKEMGIITLGSMGNANEELIERSKIYYISPYEY